MSSTPLPPPPPPGAGQPASPPPPAFAPPPTALPPGEGCATPVATGPPTDTKGLRLATVILFWVGAAMVAALSIAFTVRRATFEHAIDDPTSVEKLDAVHDADNVVDAMLRLAGLVALASIIVLCIWSLHTARHARAAGVRVSPGLACGGWWIPYANAIVPFVQLRRVARHRGRATSWVSAWQALVLAMVVLGVGLGGVSSWDDNDPTRDISNRLSGQIGLGFGLTALSLAMAYIASRAMKDVDDA